MKHLGQSLLASIQSQLKTRIENPTNEKNPQVETFYLGTNHGVYEIQQETEGILSRIGITNGALLGKPIQALAATEDVIYAGTRSGLYRYYKALPTDTTEAIDSDAASTQNITPKRWHKVEETPFDTVSVQTTSIPIWDKHPDLRRNRKRALQQSRLRKNLA